MHSRYEYQDNSIKYEYQYLYEITSEDKIKILRITGNTSEVYIPEYIEGKEVQVISSYCMAEKRHLSLEHEAELEQMLLSEYGQQQRELSGRYIESVKLPVSVVELENCAFYNCDHLKMLCAGAKLTSVHSDVFMNCTKLNQLVIEGDISEPSGVKFLLNQLSVDVTVTYVKDYKEMNQDSITARFFYPEYSENYDEIGPAHIFALNVNGEGYRARQCFKDGILLASQYDSVFVAAASSESIEVLMNMALGRLMYPKELNSNAGNIYETFIKNNENEIMCILVGKQKENELKYICEKQLVSGTAIDKAVQEAVKSGWLKGSAGMQRWRHMNRSASAAYSSRYEL